MKTRTMTILTVIAVGTAWGLPPVFANDVKVFRTAQETPPKILLEGTSNVHDWEVRGNRIDGEVSIAPVTDADGALDLKATFVDGEPKVVVRVPISTLEGSRRGMDSRMQSALDARRHSTIEFVLQEVKLPENQPSEQNTELQRIELADPPLAYTNAVQAIAIGEMKIAGSTHPARFEVTLFTGGHGLWIEGKGVVDMTDFGVDPPRALLGALRTAPEVEVSFIWSIEPNPEAAR